MSATEGIHSPHPKPVHDGDPYMLPEDVVPTAESRQTLRGAKENVEVPYLSIGSWSWGDKATWNYHATQDFPKIQEAWEILKKDGLTFIDTAQAYGDGESERICGQLIKNMPRDSYVINTKWFSLPDMTNLLTQSHGPVHKLRDSLRNLGLDCVDVYMVHGPIHTTMYSTVAKGLAECVHSGMTKVVGVANYDKNEMMKMANELEKHGVPLALNQCEYSVLRRMPEVTGLLQECRKRNIVFEGYASLAQGRLTGKYTIANEPERTKRFSSYPIHYLEQTLSVLEHISMERSVPMAAVALNYAISKGVTPICGVRNPSQAQENTQALGWRLTPEEMQRIEAVSFQGGATKLWQHG